MKNIISILFIVSLLFSCSKDEETETVIAYPEYYELVKITGSFNGSETTGSQMEWQETYMLSAIDSTFKKLRLVEEVIYEAMGTYTYKTIENQEYIEFTFNEDSDIIGNCTGDLIEVLLVLDDGEKLVATWGACDGPGLEYQKGIVFFCGTES
jgi:hypothetical protein